jgi:hypothetical protein
MSVKNSEPRLLRGAARGNELPDAKQTEGALAVKPLRPRSIEP